MNPTEILKAGCEALERSLSLHGFVYCDAGAGQSCGGDFASGNYIRGDRKLELHFRGTLGLITYHIGSYSVTHESYMREILGDRGGNQYPGFSENPLDGFHHLAADLDNYGQDFLSGSGEILIKAATQEAIRRKKQEDDSMVYAVGDIEKRERARQLFRDAQYQAVVQRLESLKYPERMTEAEKKMLEIAKRKSPPPRSSVKAKLTLFASTIKLFRK